MRRRELVKLFAGAAFAWPLAARAQQSERMPVVGFLNGASASEYANLTAAFHAGLSESGYVEGRNVLVESRWAEGHYDRLPALAADLVRRQVSVIAVNTVAAPVAKAATTTIPIVFSSAADPVKLGLVADLGRPAGNVTGVNQFTSDMAATWPALLHEIAPKARIIAMLVNPKNTTNAGLLEVQKAARKLRQRIYVLNAGSESAINAAFATLVRNRAGALIIGADPLFFSRRNLIVGLAARHGIPAIYQFREYAEAGGLMSYGANLADAYRQMGVIAGRILRGERPGDLPVQAATKFELVINRKTAEALGLTITPALAARADNLIE